MDIKRACPYCMKDFVDVRIAPTEENKDMIDRLINRESVEKVCKECNELIKHSIIFLTYSQIIDLKDGSEPQMVRTNGFFAVKDEGVKLLLKDFPEYLEQVLEARVVYITDDQAENFGFNKYLKHKHEIEERNNNLINPLVPGLDNMKDEEV